MLPPWLVFQRQRFMKPAGQIKQLHSRHALFCTTLALNLMGALHLNEFPSFIVCLDQFLHFIWTWSDCKVRLELHPVRLTILAHNARLCSSGFPSSTSAAATSAEVMTQGKPTVLLFTVHPYSPLTHGCYQSELSTNQLSTHICPMSTVCLLFSLLVMPCRREWTLWRLNQAVISRTACLFFHCLCLSDKQAWVLTYDPFN